MKQHSRVREEKRGAAWLVCLFRMPIDVKPVLALQEKRVDRLLMSSEGALRPNPDARLQQRVNQVSACESCNWHLDLRL
jgi:hypothetical protein